jgi:hypothetical protein
MEGRTDPGDLLSSVVGRYRGGGAEIGAAGRASQDFLSVLSGSQKFEFGQMKSGSRLDADFKEEYSEGPVTEIARILHGSKCRVLPLVAE